MPPTRSGPPKPIDADDLPPALPDVPSHLLNHTLLDGRNPAKPQAVLPPLTTAKRIATPGAAPASVAEAVPSAPAPTPPPSHHKAPVAFNIQNPTNPTNSTASAPILPGLDHPRLSALAKVFLTEIVTSGMMPAADIPRFLRAVGDRIPHLSTKARITDALIQFGFLTEYQCSRAMNGHYFGTVFGPYRVLSRLGSGTVGLVFLGEQTFLKRPVAIKVMAGDGNDDPLLLERFVQESQALAALNHPHVVQALDAGLLTSGLESQWYLVMEPVTGGDLEQYVYTHGAQPVEKVVRWGWQAAQGLHAAHEAGLIHRDIKPSNFLLTESLQVKVSDFGLARRYDHAITHHKSLVGSLEFLAPEQFNDPTTVLPAADTYGLAVTLFWTMTGKLPYPEGLKANEFVDHLLTQPPLRVREFNPAIPEDIDAVLFRMMARNPADRPALAFVAATFAKHAAPTSISEVAAKLPNSENYSTTEGLRYVISKLETRVAEQDGKLSSMRDAVLVAYRTAVTRKPGETLGHVQRMAAYSRLLAKKLNSLPNWSGFQSPDSEHELARAATLHDLGLIGISDTIETGAVSRTPSEEHEYRTHPVIGAAMLDYLGERHGHDLPYLRMLRDVVKHHHERWDGTGWPDALQGEKIPPAARIIAVADAYDRLRAPSADKRGMAHEDAVSAICREAGTKFDPDVIEAFKSIAGSFGDLFATIPDDPTTAPLTAEQLAAANRSTSNG